MSPRIPPKYKVKVTGVLWFVIAVQFIYILTLLYCYETLYHVAVPPAAH